MQIELANSIQLATVVGWACLKWTQPQTFKAVKSNIYIIAAVI